MTAAACGGAGETTSAPDGSAEDATPPMDGGRDGTAPPGDAGSQPGDAGSQDAASPEDGDHDGGPSMVPDAGRCSGGTPPAPTISNSGSTVLCVGASETLTSSAASGNVWSNGETSQAIDVTQAGSYSVHTTGANGCQSPESSPVDVTIDAPAPPPTVTVIGPAALCTGGNASVTLESSATTGNVWSDGETSQTIHATKAMFYSVSVEDAHGCKSAASSPVAVTTDTPATPIIMWSGPLQFCAGGSVTLTSNATSGNSWSTNATSQSITVKASGEYILTTTDALGCTASAVATVSVTTPAGGSQTFHYTSGTQTWTVPSCVTSIHISMWGAAGGDAGTTSCPGKGGRGGYMSGTYAIPPGTQSLAVIVGGAGVSTAVGLGGGYDGGGAALGNNGACPSYNAGSGGGATEVDAVDAAGKVTPVMIAGGGGGAGCFNGNATDYGGAGGGLVGGTGPEGVLYDGQGGTQSAGGQGATFAGIPSESGARGQGGDGTCAYASTYYCGAGGGGGYYGGGGGCEGSGGGGSSYATPPITNLTDTPGYASATGDGSVTISW